MGTGVLQGELLDTTATELIDEYVNFVLGTQFITDSRWFHIEAKATDNLDDVAKILSRRADHLHKIIATETNYNQALPDNEKDTILDGHGLMYIEETEGAMMAKCHTVNNLDLVLLQNLSGDIYYAAWPIRKRGFELIDEFGYNGGLTREDKAYIQDNLEKRFVLLTTYTRNAGAFAEPTPEGLNFEPKFIMRYVAYDTSSDSSFVSMDSRVINIDKSKFFRENVCFPTRNMYFPDNPYGKGIGKRALPKARILNKSNFNMMKLAGLQANPPVVYHPDLGEVPTNGLQEGQVIRFGKEQNPAMQSPKELATVLDIAGDLRPMAEMYLMQKQQLEAFLPTAGAIYSAARQSVPEIHQRLQEQEERLAPLRVNFLKEGPSRHLKLLYAIANRRAKFNSEMFQFPENSNVTIKDITFDAHLLSKFKQGKALRLAQALSVNANFFSLTPSAVDLLDGDKITRLIFKGHDCLDALDTDANVANKRAQRQEQIQQQQQIESQRAESAAGANQIGVVSALKELREQ